MGFAAPERISLTGELRERICRNRRRMASACYALPEVFSHGPDGAGGWPGDWEGRTLLAQILIGRAAGEMPSPLQANLAALPGQLNAEGYIGRINREVIDEQQLSGNSWLLRAICEWYEWTQEPAVLERVRAASRGLFLPLRGKYTVYPMEKSSRLQGHGQTAGEVTGEVVNGWALSTDIGCAFIPLDGVTHAYHLTRDPDLEPVIEEMIDVFFGADVQDAVFQTHATLSALRGVLRYAADTNIDRYLPRVKERFALYCEKGMTETFANQNWFGRPEWTEPCAIIDSLLVAMQLWEHTRDSRYLALAHEIYYNALCFAQRENGGFGCDSCVGADGDDTLFCRIYEASWCCTMRGGEGLARAAQYTAHSADDGVRLLFYHSGQYTLDVMTLTVASSYPNEGTIEITVERNDGADLLLWLPPWAEDPHCSAEGKAEGDFLRIAAPKAGSRIVLRFAQHEKTVPARSALMAGRQIHRRGAQILGDPGDGTWVPIGQATFAEKAVVEQRRWKIID